MPNSPKIFCLQHSSLFESFGGVEYYLDDLLTLLAKTYGEENVLSLIPKRTENFELQARPYQIKTVDLVRKSALLRKLENRYSVSFFQNALREIKKFQPTILLNSHVSLGPTAYLLHQITKVPLITVVYGIDAWGGLFPQDEFALRRSNQILSISYWTKRILMERNYASNQIRIVHPMLDPRFEKELPVRQVKANSPFRMLTVSRLDAEEQYKGHDHVLQGLHQTLLKKPDLNIHYTIQGDGTDKPRLEKMVRDLRLGQWVEFKSAVKDRDQLKTSYEACDLFVMPSRFGKWDKKWKGEGFGIVYVEAASFGVPSLAYDCGGATDIIRNEETGILVKPDSIPALSDQILELATHPERTLEMGKAAYKHVMKSFTQDAVQSEIRTAFEE